MHQKQSVIDSAVVNGQSLGQGDKVGGGVNDEDHDRVFVGEDDDDADGDVMEAPVEVADPKRIMPTPILPSPSDIQKHRECHIPYQSWCEDCVEGRGREMGHSHVDMAERSVPTIAFDYLFINDKGVFLRTEVDETTWEDDPTGIKVLVIKDSRSKMLFAHVVPTKGIDVQIFAVNMLTDDIVWLGYSRVILKSDNEPAIIKLGEEAMKDLRITMEQVATDHPPPYDSQANGQAESGCKSVRGQLKTIRNCLQRRLGQRIPARHPLMAWMVPHAAFLISYRVQGHDGKTAYNRNRGRPYGGRLLGIGEVCRYKIRSKEAIADASDGNRYHNGVFIGINRRDGQYILAGQSGVHHARTVLRVPEEQKWNLEMLQSVSATPFDEHQVREPEVVFRQEGQKEEVAKPQAVVARRVYIRAPDLEAFGHTRGCPRCEHELKYGPNRSGKPHSDICRARIMGELAKTEQGRLRLQSATNRLDTTIAEMGERMLAQGEETQVVPAVHTPLGTELEVVPRFEKFAEPAVGVGFDSGQEATQMEPAIDNNMGEAIEVDSNGRAVVRDEAGMDIGVVAGQPTTFGSVGSMLPSTDETAAPLADTSKTPEVGGESKPSVGEQEFEKDFRELSDMWTRDLKADMRKHNEEILSVIDSLGGSRNQYRRERNRGIRMVVSEIYSPPRVTAAIKLLPELRCIPGFALDLTTTDTEGRPWDFDDYETRERARKIVREEKLEARGTRKVQEKGGEIDVSPPSKNKRK